MHLNLRPNRGFTLLELLVVIAILGILTALILAAVSGARAASARTACANHLRQLGLALHSYHQDHGSFPPGVYHPALHPALPRLYGPDRDPFPLMNWQGRLLPYIEQDALWVQIQSAYAQDRFLIDNPPHVGINQRVLLFTCPADGVRVSPGKSIEQSPATSSYLGVEGINHNRVDGILYLDSGVRFAGVTDGLTHTLLVGERPSSRDLSFGRWYGTWGQWGTVNSTLGVRESDLRGLVIGCPDGPYQFQRGGLGNPCSVFHFWSLHPGGANFLFADGRVGFLTYSAADTLPALATRAGGEVIPTP